MQIGFGQGLTDLGQHIVAIQATLGKPLTYHYSIPKRSRILFLYNLNFIHIHSRYFASQYLYLSRCFYFTFQRCFAVLLSEVMTELMLRWAEHEWIEGKDKEAYELAKTAKYFDPYFEGVDRYVTALSIHYAGEFDKNKLGYTDLYALLGFKTADYPSITHNSIKQRYTEYAMLVHPSEFSSPMAHGALRLMDKAWAVLGNEQRREDYDVCVGLRRPKPKSIDKPETATETSIAAATVQTDDQRPKVGMKRCAPLTATADKNMGRIVRHRRV